MNGQAIVGEAGPELLTNKNGKTTVTPLSNEEKRKGIGGKVQPAKVEQHIHIGNVDANNPSELNKMNRKILPCKQTSTCRRGSINIRHLAYRLGVFLLCLQHHVLGG